MLFLISGDRYTHHQHLIGNILLISIEENMQFMSNPKVQEFLTKVGEDSSLQTELSHALESDNDRQAVTDLAKSKGYEFSSDELWAEVQKRQAEFGTKETAEELSEADLEAVAGGAFAISPTIIVNQATRQGAW
jgi:predicted ribosomally synthesized peptide with nif11-like leader